jgi:type VI secretion system secreted protein Hcp
MFLKLAGIDGESTDKGHENWIEIESFSWDVTQTGSLGTPGGGGGTGRAAPADFSIVMPFSSASPLIFKKAVTGEHIESAQVSVRKAGGQSQDFLKYEFDTVFVTKVDWVGSGGDERAPGEEVTFQFEKISVSYAPTLPDGRLGQAITASFDFIKLA